MIVITAYLDKYHKPLTEIPRVFFKVKENVLLDNPEKGTTGKVLAKYILNPKYKAGDKVINLQGDEK